MDQFDWGGIVIAAIGVISAWLAGRAARNAAKIAADATTMNTRTQAETDAYHRARKMDIETITRQDEEINELVAKVRALERANETLRARIAALEGRRRHG